MMAARKVTGNAMHAYEHERIREVLARVQELNASLSKHQQIRINHWVRKLLDQPVSNPTWMKNVMEYAATLLKMLTTSVVDEPFTKMPPQGPLPTLPRHKVAGLINQGVMASRPPIRMKQPQQGRPQPALALLERLLNENEATTSHPPEARKETQSRQVQTCEQDDQWDWQRVWKGAFEKMQNELHRRNAHIQATTAELKELRALVDAQKHALEQDERTRAELQAKHQAEVDNLKSVHALEIETLKAKHKKQLAEVSVRNEAVLRERRREVEAGGPFNMQSESYGDFLAYIDDFYADTLKLTQTA